jgi:hypothetical protein
MNEHGIVLFHFRVTMADIEIHDCNHCPYSSHQSPIVEVSCSFSAPPALGESLYQHLATQDYIVGTCIFTRQSTVSTRCCCVLTILNVRPQYQPRSWQARKRRTTLVLSVSIKEEHAGVDIPSPCRRYKIGMATRNTLVRGGEIQRAFS